MNKQMMRRLTSFASPLLFAVMSVLSFEAQALAQEKPLPEHQRLEIWTGEWSYVDQGAIGTVTGEWFGEFLIRWTGVFETASGDTLRGMGMIAYDPEEELYTMSRFYDNGHRDIGKGWVHDDTWTFLFDPSAEERWRATLVEESADTMTYKWERSIKGGPWEVTSEGRGSRAT
jgi:hypothetical protein